MVVALPVARHPSGPFHRLAAAVIAVAVCVPLVGTPRVVAEAAEGHHGHRVIRVVPSSNDTAALQAALDAASVSGPGAVIELGPGTFHVSQPLVALNFSGTIRGAGLRRTTVLADGSSNPHGLFPAPTSFAPGPFLFSFKESDVDRAGQPVSTRRSQNITMEDLTLGASGRTAPHYDINVNAQTQRLFSLVWIEGFRSGWTNSAGETPFDTGTIDAEQAQVSTVRATFTRVHFDGRNVARAAGASGGPFSRHPDVRNGFGIVGAVAVKRPPPNPIIAFKPINAALSFEQDQFTDLPGQAGIFAPELVGRGDHAWSFGPDAVPGELSVTDSVFKDTSLGVSSGDLSDVTVQVDDSTFRRTDSGVSLWTNYQATDGAAITYPRRVAPSRVTVLGNRFVDSRVVAVWMDEYQGPSRVAFTARSNEFVLATSSEVGVLGTSLDGARFIGNAFNGKGYGAVVAVNSRRWLVKRNDFCNLLVPPSATASAFLGLPSGENGKPLVLFDSSLFSVVGNHCP
jgi:hypothetical protein